MRWRHLRPGELDHEGLWLAITLSLFLMGWMLIHFSVPLPPCLWHQMTGLPCPGCGGTRCARAIVAGSLGTAFKMNPFVFISLAVVVLYDIYAATVLFFRLPRLRFTEVPPWLGLWTRIGVAVLFAANWAWLMIARR